MKVHISEHILRNQFSDDAWTRKLFEKYMTILNDFQRSIVFNINPIESINSFKKEASELNDLWTEHNSHKNDRINMGFHIRTPFVDTLSDRKSNTKFNFQTFIKQEFCYFFNWNSYKPMEYNAEKFKEMCRMECIALIAKYGYANDYEIYYAMYAMLLKYFSVTSRDQSGRIRWAVNSEYIKECIDEVINSDIDLEKYLSYIGISEEEFYQNLYHIQNPKYEKNMPKTREEIEMLFVKNLCDTASKKYQILIETYAKINSERTARKVMKEFGLSRKYTNRQNTENEEVMTNNEILETVIEKIDELQDIIEKKNKENRNLIFERFQTVINMMTRPLSHKELKELIDKQEKSDIPDLRQNTNNLFDL